MREFEVSPGQATLQEYSLIIGLTRGHAPCSSGPDHELGVTGSGESQAREHRQAAGHRGGAGGAGQGEVLRYYAPFTYFKSQCKVSTISSRDVIINSLFPNNVLTFDNGITMQCVFSLIHAKCKMMWNQHLLPLVMK